MSIHPSLSTAQRNKKTRSVLKRAERLKTLIDKGTWSEGKGIYGLPKIKTVRLKIKKEKAAPAAATAPAQEQDAAKTAASAEQPAKPKA